MSEINNKDVNSRQAIAFLKLVLPTGPWVLSAIAVDKPGIETRTFGPSTEPACLEWIIKYYGLWNLYYHVNPVRHAVYKKAQREDIKEVIRFHVDIDPRAGELLKTEQTRIEKLLENPPHNIPKPTTVVFSGGGYQAFWTLKNPIGINGNLEAAEEAKLYNKYLENVFNADNCHNIDRLMRLPGTINIPDEKKRAKGRVPTLAKLIWHENTLKYELSKFQKLQAKPPIQNGDQPLKKFSNPISYSSIDDLNELNLPYDLKTIVIHGCDLDNPKEAGDTSRSAWLFHFICRSIKHGLSDEIIYSIILCSFFQISESVLDKNNPEEYATRQISRAHERINNSPLILDPQAPLTSAKEYRDSHRENLIHHNDEWLDYAHSHYKEVEDNTVKSNLYTFLDAAFKKSKDKIGPFLPKPKDVENIFHALKALVHRQRDSFFPPCWFENSMIPADEIISFNNGLLHLPSKKMYPHTPKFFTRYALTFNYDPNVHKPVKWYEFIKSLWPSNPEAISTLQEIFGYLLTTNTSLQKIFLLIGPPRSGKGTIARLLTELVGKSNICSPTLYSLNENFGLQSLIGKQIAFISDMRIGGKTDQAALVENLLRISGEDSVTVARKYKDDWQGKLSTRFFIMTNELPRLHDPSGALASRFIPIVMTRSFLNEENPNLANELTAELPAILNWAIEGWERLHARGHFLIPATSAELMSDIADLGSPVLTFIKEMCVLESNASIPKAKLYEAFRSWQGGRGDPLTGDSASFGRDLNAVLHGRIKTQKSRNGRQRTGIYVGIKLGITDSNEKMPF